MTKPSSALQKQFLLNQVKPIFITTEALHIERSVSSTTLLRTTKMQLRLTQIISRLFTIVPSAGTNLANMINLKLIIRVQSIYSLRIYQPFITWEPYEKRWAVISLIWHYRISTRLLIYIKIMLRPSTEEALYGTDFTNTMKQFKTFQRLLE